MAVVLCFSADSSKVLASRQVIVVPLKAAKAVKDSVEVIESPSSSVSINVYGDIDTVRTVLVIDTNLAGDEISHV